MNNSWYETVYGGGGSGRRLQYPRQTMLLQRVGQGGAWETVQADLLDLRFEAQTPLWEQRPPPPLRNTLWRVRLTGQPPKKHWRIREMTFYHDLDCTRQFHPRINTE